MSTYAPRFARAVEEVLARHGVDGRPLSNRVAAQRTGHSPATINNWRSKRMIPTRDALVQFADRLSERRVPLLLSAGYVPDTDDIEHDEDRFPDARSNDLPRLVRQLIAHLRGPEGGPELGLL